MRNDSVHHDCIRPVDADLCIAGMEDDDAAATRGPVKVRRYREPRGGKCPKTLAWTQEDDDSAFDPIALLTPRQAAAVSVLQYDAAMRRIFSGRAS